MGNYNRDRQTTTAGVSAVELLTIVFVVLKLTHVIEWSWWWVLSPIWISIILVIILVFIFIKFYRV